MTRPSRAGAALAALLPALALLPAPASAAEARRVALVLGPAPAGDDARAEAVQAAALTLLGLAAPREDELVKFTVVLPGEDRTLASQTLDAGIARIGDWGRSAGRKGDASRLADALAWVGGGGLVVHVGAGAKAGERQVALRLDDGRQDAVLEAVGHALDAVWADDDRVTVLGPARSIRPPAGAAQFTVLSLGDTPPAGYDRALFDWGRDGPPPARAWYGVAPGLKPIAAERPVLAVVSTIEVTVDACPAVGETAVSYTVWPPGADEAGLELRFAGPALAAPLTLAGEGGTVRLTELILGDFTISPRLRRTPKNGPGRELVVGPTKDCHRWPAIVATPHIDAMPGDGGGEIQVSFTDAAGAPVPAAQVFAAGDLEVLVDRGDVDQSEPVQLTLRDDLAFAPMPARAGEAVRLRIEPERSERRLLGGAVAVVPPIASAGAISPWLVGLCVAAFVALLGAAWPHLVGWLIARLPSARVVPGMLAVRLRGVLVNQLHVDAETLFPALAVGMHPIPLGSESDAPALVRLELVRGVRGVRLVAYIADGTVVSTRSRRLTRLPWALGDMTVELRA